MFRSWSNIYVFVEPYILYDDEDVGDEFQISNHNIDQIIKTIQLTKDITTKALQTCRCP